MHNDIKVAGVSHIHPLGYDNSGVTLGPSTLSTQLYTLTKRLQVPILPAVLQVKYLLYSSSPWETRLGMKGPAGRN